MFFSFGVSVASARCVARFTDDFDWSRPKKVYGPDVRGLTKPICLEASASSTRPAVSRIVPFAPSLITSTPEGNKVSFEDSKDEQTDADAHDCAGGCRHPRLEPDHCFRKVLFSSTRVRTHCLFLSIRGSTSSSRPSWPSQWMALRVSASRTGTSPSCHTHCRPCQTCPTSTFWL